jgi:hypothetical protein
MAAESVGVYFMYYILHDWNDEYCIKILKNRLQNGKLKKGGWIVLAESVIPPPENNYKDHSEIGHANADGPGKP